MAPFMMLVSRTSTAPDVTHAGHSVASPAPAAAVEAALRGFAGPRWPSAARSIIFEALVKVKLPPVAYCKLDTNHSIRPLHRPDRLFHAPSRRIAQRRSYPVLFSVTSVTHGRKKERSVPTSRKIANGGSERAFSLPQRSEQRNSPSGLPSTTACGAAMAACAPPHVPHHTLKQR